MILAKKTDSIIAKSDWYQANKSVKSEFKAYALGLLNEYVKKQNKFLDYVQVWNAQAVPESFVKVIEKAIEIVRAHMLQSYPDLADWREKFKLKYVWEEVAGLDLDLSEEEIEDITVSEETQKTEDKTARKQAKQDDAMRATIFCTEVPRNHWNILLNFFERNPGMTQYVELNVLRSMANGRIPVPSDKQAKILQKLYCLAEQHDVKFS